MILFLWQKLKKKKNKKKYKIYKKNFLLFLGLPVLPEKKNTCKKHWKIQYDVKRFFFSIKNDNKDIYAFGKCI